MVSTAAMNELFTWKNARKNTMKEHMISTSWIRPNSAASPENTSKRMAM